MATHTAYAGAATAGEVLTAAHVNDLPGGWLGYVEATSSQSGVTSEVDLTGITVTVTVGTSRRIKITFYSPRAGSANSSEYSRFTLKEGGTQLQTRTLSTEFGGQYDQGGTMEWVGTPTGGSHTYKVTFQRLTGSGNHTAVAGATEPMWLLVEDLGPA
jgi:hypothetical protein